MKHSMMFCAWLLYYVAFEMMLYAFLNYICLIVVL